MDKITVKQAAALLSVTDATIRNYIRKGILIAEKQRRGQTYILWLSKKEVAQLLN